MFHAASPYWLLTSLGLGLLSSACHRGADGYYGSTDRAGRDPGTLYITNGEPESLDPGKSWEVLGQQYAVQLFEGLLAYGPEDLRPVQGVARAWERSDDGLVYRFHLRPEARWSDGRPVTSHDFVYSWRRVLDPATASRVAPDLYPLRHGEAFNKGLIADGAAVGVRALDDHTLEVELERPTPYFLGLLCRPSYAPVRRDVVEALARRGEEDLWTRPEHIVVNGPYTIEAWRFRHEIVMTENPHYWARDSLRVRRVVWVQADSSQAGMNLYRTSEVDLLTIPPSPQHHPLVRPLKDYRLYPGLVSYWLDVNTRARPVDDARVRRALDLAIDKAALAERIGDVLPATHYAPDNTGGGYAEQAAEDRAAGRDPFAGGDPERARALLREAGYEIVEEAGGRRAEGFPPLTLIYTTGHDVPRLVAVALQGMWRRHLGVAISLQEQEPRVLWGSSLPKGDFQLAATGWTADYNHPHTFLENFVSTSPQNMTGWADPAFDDLLSRAGRAPDPRESIRLYRRAEARAVAGMSRIPLVFPMGAMLVKPWVKGFRGNGQSQVLVRWLWIDPAWRDRTDDAPAAAALELPPPGRIP